MKNLPFTDTSPLVSVANNYDINTGDIINYDSNGDEITAFRIRFNDSIGDDIVKLFMVILTATLFWLFLSATISRLWVKLLILIVTIVFITCLSLIYLLNTIFAGSSF